jgi:hypothetical protein
MLACLNFFLLFLLYKNYEKYVGLSQLFLLFLLYKNYEKYVGLLNFFYNIKI